jgi:hypothetical protein
MLRTDRILLQAATRSETDAAKCADKGWVNRPVSGAESMESAPLTRSLGLLSLVLLSLRMTLK